MSWAQDVTTKLKQFDKEFVKQSIDLSGGLACSLGGTSAARGPPPPRAGLPLYMSIAVEGPPSE